METHPEDKMADEIQDFGELPAEIIGAIEQMRARVHALTFEIGKMETRKLGMVEEIRHLEHQAQGMLQDEAKKLNIPEGTVWQLTPEGRAVSAPQG